VPTTSRTIRIGTRGSKLARWQAEWVAGELAARDVPVELVPITTKGDVTSGPLGQIGGIGLFTKEIQLALLDDRIDVAVHSLKDLPTIDIPELALAAVPRREECGDALVSRVAVSLAELPEGAKVGTGSMRRKAQLLHFRNDLNVLDIRGNIDTRLKKLDDGEFDAIILAEAGLRRMGWHDRIACCLPREQMLPAVGQGALGLEIRADDHPTRDAIAALNDTESHAAVSAERSMLQRLSAGCLAPVGAWGRMTGDGQLQLDAAVFSTDGAQKLSATAVGPPNNAIAVGSDVADDLLAQGGGELIAAARR